ncbi:UNVERIFIED_CONTAM: protein FAR1-RELATED SEQUENCE 3 [Sesamum radiatum]|uniref:Protein FAR1-RELATED SEQUENCE n=1 Tax=Sesamum radiatum TaxID=300843 RepID=A0AAW2V8J0_SESRA
MDAEVIEVDMERRQRNRGSYTHCSDDGEENLTESSSVGGMSNEVDDRSEKPYVGMEFESEEAAKNLYDAYARRMEIMYFDPNPVVGNTSPIETNRTVRNASPAEKIPIVRNLSSFETNRATTHTIPVMPLQFIQPSSRRRTLGRDAQNLLTYFRKMQAENPGFYYAIQLDDENRLSNVFWADARSRTAYSHFGDAVVFDTMYRPNQFQVPFAPFTGMNNHGQMVLFGCALLLDESEASFAWVFKTWLSAMNDQPPVSITTDQDRAIKAAVHQVFPGTRHCICKWHILREGQERKQWAPVYFRDTFFAALSSNHGVSSFFDGYVNQQTTIPMFFKQYERALENSLEREIEADYDTMCTTPVLKTPSPMEQQAANLYTKKVFAKFQEELVKLLYTLPIKDGDGSCQMFEYSGVLCRHILTVFTVTNVLTIPSHYILKRWTRNARASLSDEQEIDMQCMESLTVRFNNLCREALKFAEVGAIAAETYNAAMDVLLEGARKISVVKKSVTKIKSPSSQGSGSFQDNGSKKTSVSIPDTVPSLWPWQDTAQNHFNNDAGPPVADLNHPTMAPIAINRDGSLADNSVVLTCFKSMTWVIENKNPASKVAVINLKLHDYGKTPSGETEVQFRLTRVTLEPMLKSMAYISQQLSTPANRVAVINLKLQDTKTTSGEAEVKFQVSRDTLGSMLRSMAYIREQL